MGREAITGNYREENDGRAQMRRWTQSSREIASSRRWFVSDLLASWAGGTVQKIDIQGVCPGMFRADICQRGPPMIEYQRQYGKVNTREM